MSLSFEFGPHEEETPTEILRAVFVSHCIDTTTGVTFRLLSFAPFELDYIFSVRFMFSFSCTAEALSCSTRSTLRKKEVLFRCFGFPKINFLFMSVYLIHFRYAFHIYRWNEMNSLRSVSTKPQSSTRAELVVDSVIIVLFVEKW